MTSRAGSSFQTTTLTNGQMPVCRLCLASEANSPMVLSPRDCSRRSKPVSSSWLTQKKQRRAPLTTDETKFRSSLFRLAHFTRRRKLRGCARSRRRPLRRCRPPSVSLDAQDRNDRRLRRLRRSLVLRHRRRRESRLGFLRRHWRSDRLASSSRNRPAPAEPETLLASTSWHRGNPLNSLASRILSMPFILRRLEATDIPLLRQLNALFGRAFAEPATFADDPPSDGYLRDMLTKEHIAVVVALKGETVVGGLVAYALGKFKKERREYYIYDLLPVLAPFEFGFGRIF